MFSAPVMSLNRIRFLTALFLLGTTPINAVMVVLANRVDVFSIVYIGTGFGFSCLPLPCELAVFCVSITAPVGFSADGFDTASAGSVWVGCQAAILIYPG